MISEKVLSEDGSFTFLNSRVGEHYKSVSGALSESFEKHCKGLKLEEFKGNSCTILDVCSGLCYNALAAISTLRKNNPSMKITIHFFENDKRILDEIISNDLSSYNGGVDVSFYKLIQEFIASGKDHFEKDSIVFFLHFGDVLERIKDIDNNIADFVFFDPFSPKKEPSLWSVEFFTDVFNKMKSNSKLSTYCYAVRVRKDLENVGFKLSDGPVYKRRSPSTIALKP